MSNLYAFPPLEDDGTDECANKIVNYQRQACEKNDPTRLQRFTDNEDARFTIASKPWMAPPIGSNPETPFFEPIRVDDEKIKLANRNETAPIIESEVARLIGSTAEPAVTPSKPTTVVHRAAKKGEMILQDILRELGWVEILHKDADNAVSYGTSWLLSGWENDYTEMKEGPAMVHGCDNVSPTDGKCGWTVLSEGGEKQPGGGYRFAGEVGRDMVEAGIGSTVSQSGDQDMSATLHECPECGGPLTLRRALPDDGDEHPSGKRVDAFGFDLTEEKPLPKVFVQGFPDLDVFPIGGGRVSNGFLPEVTIECIRPIDWLMQRYEHAGDIEPMALGEMQDLGRWHPAGLEMWGYEGHTLYTDQKRWAVYRITIREPFIHPKDEKKSEPLGRLMISANKTVLFNGPLLFEYETADGETNLIPRMKLFPFANKAQNDSVHGISTTSRLLGPQKVLDAMFTQFQYDMAENGSPTLAMPKGANIEGQGDGYQTDESQPNVPNHIIYFDADAGKPEVMGGKVTHEAWEPFTRGIIEHMQRTTVQSQLDQGKSATGAPSASAQMYIGQRLDETRKPKGQRWAERLSALFSYMLKCVVAVYTERRQFKAVDALDNRTVRDFAGADLMGQTTVVVSTKPAHDNEAFQRQNILELLPLGLIDISTPRQRLDVGKALGIEDKMASEPNQQVKIAQNEFLDYTLPDVPVRPIANKRLDDHSLHIGSHMEDANSPAFQSRMRMRNFYTLATDGAWEAFEAIQAAKLRLKTMPAPEPVLLADPLSSEPGAVDMDGTLAQVAAKKADDKLAAEISQLPENIQEQIELIFTKKMQAYEGFAALLPEDQKDAMELLVFLAHKDAHEWYEKEEQMALAPQPVATQTQGDAVPGAPQPMASAAPAGAPA